jgi:hypothetical protein
MVFMDRSSFLLRFVLAALLLASSANPAAARAPRGLFEIGGDAWTNPGISGWRAEIKWSAANPADGVYDWSRIDGLIANSVQYQRQIGLSITLLSSPPDWVTKLPGAKTYYTSLGPDPMVLPFDPVVQPRIIAFIEALCQHFDDRLDYIVMGGLGYKTESYMPLPSEIGLNMTVTDYTDAWVSSSALLIDTYNQNLSATPFILASGAPFSDPQAAAAIMAIINHGLLYPNFGMMQWGLNATSNNGFFINKLIQDNSSDRSTGFQLTGASDGSVGGDLKGTLEQALDAGVGLGADWIEIYAVDAMNPAYVSLLAAINSELKALPAPTPTPSPTPPPPPKYLLNISTRVDVQSGDSAMIGGFIISGNANKNIVIRALGPSLATQGVQSVLADPVLELHDSAGQVIASNNNWIPLIPNVLPVDLNPGDPSESVIAVSLAPGIYTAVLQGVNGSVGNALCELYDLEPGDSSVLNISTRGQVGSGDNVMIGGFIVGGTDPQKVIIRGIGPSLTAAGVSGALADPIVELHNSDGSLIFQNDNWRSDQEDEIIATRIPPSDSKESAIVATLNPGAYTAIVRGAANTAGVALVEVYALDQ